MDVNGEQDGSRVVSNGARFSDPSALTTAQILREVFMLRELLESRLDGYDRAISLLQARADKSPSIDVVAQNVGSLEKVMDEKFRSVEKQFIERDVRVEQSSSAGQIAINAAFAAAKEGVEKQNANSALATAKSEASFVKQIDQLVNTINVTVKASDDKIDDLKARIGAIEGRATGATAQVQTQQASSGNVLAIISAVIAVAAVGVAVVAVVN